MQRLDGPKHWKAFVSCRVIRTAVSVFIPTALYFSATPSLPEPYCSLFLFVFAFCFALSAPLYEPPNKNAIAEGCLPVADWALNGRFPQRTTQGLGCCRSKAVSGGVARN